MLILKMFVHFKNHFLSEVNKKVTNEKEKIHIGANMITKKILVF